MSLQLQKGRDFTTNLKIESLISDRNLIFYLISICGLLDTTLTTVELRIILLPA
jgi:hypothetical protein